MIPNSVIEYCIERGHIRKKYFTPDTENSYLNSNLIRIYPDPTTIEKIGNFIESFFVYAILDPEQQYGNNINYEQRLKDRFHSLMAKPENQSKSALLYDYITEINQLTDKYFTHHYIRKNVTFVYNLIKDYQQTQIQQSIWY